jgi:glycine cleavage system transcriptional repressor
MKKIIISVIGPDRPGIIAAVTRTFYEHGCNIESVSQTILQDQFSGMFIASMAPGTSIRNLRESLGQTLAPMDLHVLLKPLKAGPPDPALKRCEPFVITTRGPDRKGLVAGITEIIARHRANVTHLQAVFKGGQDPNDNIMIYEVDVPAAADQPTLEAELRERAVLLGLEISIQHRRIFEAINRI